MKKIACLFLTLLILFTACIGLTASAAGSLSAGASASSVTVGSTVKLTLTYNGGGAPIASIDSRVQYNVNTFQYVSCSGASANGDAGIIRLSYYYYGDDTAPTKVAITLTFKAIAAGPANFSIGTDEFRNDNNGSSLGTPSKSVSVSAINPTKSSNANLSNIRPSSGTLTPAFKASVTSYTISVPYTTTSLSLSATTQDKGARTSVSGKNTLAVGKNTQVITVTAPNGTTKKYTVVITRAAKQEDSSSPSSDPIEPPPSDPLEVEVDGVLLTLSDTQPAAELPQGFAWSNITINEINVSAAINKTSTITLVYLINPADNTGAFHIYNATADKFYPFCPLAVSGGSYVLLEMPADQAAPTGTVAGKQTFDKAERDVFLFEDETLKDIVLVYAASPAGTTGLYIYDTTDGSMQLYRAISVPADSVPQPTQPTDNAFVQFITQYRSIILVCAAAIGGLALFIATVILLVFFVKRDNTKGKH